MQLYTNTHHGRFHEFFNNFPISILTQIPESRIGCEIQWKCTKEHFIFDILWLLLATFLEMLCCISIMDILMDQNNI